MEELLRKTRQLDQEVDEVLPLLIADEWQMAGEKIPQMFSVLNECLSLLMQQAEEQLLIEIKSMLSRMIYAVKNGDSIQLADILAYEVGSMIQNVYDVFDK